MADTRVDWSARPMAGSMVGSMVDQWVGPMAAYWAGNWVDSTGIPVAEPTVGHSVA